jgi:hypothetical protein
MAKKHYDGAKLTRKDRFQVAAFQAHYRIAIRAGHDRLTAIAVAIVATSDEATSKALAKHPDAVQQWMATNGWGRKALNA